MPDEIDKQFDFLTSAIRKYESVRVLKEDSELFIRKAIVWIRYTQKPEGYWGEKSMLATQLSLLALSLWDDKTRSWALPDGKIGGVNICFEWLEQSHKHGAWDYNIWDTSAILQAAARFDKLDRPVMKKAKEWLENQQSNSWGVSNEGFGAHYISQALITMVEIESPPEVISEARDLLLQVAETISNQPTMTPYIAGQVVSALIVSGVNPAHAPVAKISKKLLNYLLTTDVTISNWLHLCVAFRGLNMVLGSDALDTPDIQKVIQRLFSPNRLREDGSWYRDVALTAWALIALNSVRSVRKIDGYSYDILSSVELTRRNIQIKLRNERRLKPWLFIYGFVLPFLLTALASLVGLYLYNNTNVFSSSDWIFFLIPTIIGAISWILIRVRQLLR